MHPSENHGAPFKLLGPTRDPDLRMHTCIDQLLSNIRSKSTAILRTRAYYSSHDLVGQYKCHVWGLVEANCGAYFHATNTLLDKIAQVQRSFLTKLELSEKQAFLEFNFAPTDLRRNIAILGALHKRVLGLCHPSFVKLLPWHRDRFPEDSSDGHDKKLYGHRLEAKFHPALFSRSIFAMIDIYNVLPQYVVDAASVSIFQHRLTDIARRRCEMDVPAWADSFNRRRGPDCDWQDEMLEYLD